MSSEVIDFTNLDIEGERIEEYLNIYDLQKYKELKLSGNRDMCAITLMACLDRNNINTIDTLNLSKTVVYISKIRLILENLDKTNLEYIDISYNDSDDEIVRIIRENICPTERAKIFLDGISIRPQV